MVGDGIGNLWLSSSNEQAATTVTLCRSSFLISTVPRYKYSRQGNHSKNITSLATQLVTIAEMVKMFFKRGKKGGEAPDVVADGSITSAPGPNPNMVEGAEPQPETLAPVRSTATEDIVYPSGLKLALLMSSVFMSMFLVALVCFHLFSVTSQQV